MAWGTRRYMSTRPAMPAKVQNVASALATKGGITSAGGGAQMNFGSGITMPQASDSSLALSNFVNLPPQEQAAPTAMPKPPATNPLPIASLAELAGKPTAAPVVWNGQPNAPGDPWISGSGYGGNTYTSPVGNGQPIAGNPAGLLGEAGAGQRIGGADWWAAIQAMQGRG